EHCAFVSSINAYPGWPAAADYHLAGPHDGDPDATRSDVPGDLDEGSAYGWLKVGCERAALRAFGPQRCAILRAGAIVGPHDSAVGRLPWVIDRVARGGEVLVPGAPADPIALIDSRDLARFALSGAAGTFETGGPTGRDTRADLFAACLAATGSAAEPTYVHGEWLAEQDVAAWTEVPLWVPAAEGPSVFAHDNSAAQAAGLRWRPLADTVADTWAWQRSLPGGWTASNRAPGAGGGARAGAAGRMERPRLTGGGRSRLARGANCATVCYMESVGVRELRQNASALLDRVAERGVTIEVTNHGRPVARLVPVPRQSRSSRSQLIQAGVLHPGRGSILDVAPVAAPAGTPRTEQLLDADRGDR
ncbi:MAG TPA: type II toxin-antitoxin system prevent-host-death family antitoxin, partial [Jatrophihabitans sp.]|nr:type II toxin-antitoxin system prevent-host-death family antitoxin [Jatrophihabitans sp.]